MPSSWSTPRRDIDSVQCATLYAVAIPLEGGLNQASTVYRVFLPVVVLAFAVVVSACGKSASGGTAAQSIARISQPPPPPPPPPPDVGDIRHFHNCRNIPRRALSQSEACLVEKLRADCTAAADCVLTCLSSPDGANVGGGCDHVCFGYEIHHSWNDRPKAMDECREQQHG